MDWVWEGASFTLAVEVKIHDGTIFQPDQLDRYVAAAKHAGKVHYGALALVSAFLPREVLGKVQRRRGFIGAVTWTDAEPLLRLVCPSATEDANRWSALLDEVLSD